MCMPQNKSSAPAQAPDDQMNSPLAITPTPDLLGSGGASKAGKDLKIRKNKLDDAEKLAMGD